MEVIITNKITLEPFELPFPVTFVTTEKRGEDVAWFTPSGKAKLWFGGLRQKPVGSITLGEERRYTKDGGV